jgi:hypothetical protein
MRLFVQHVRWRRPRGLVLVLGLAAGLACSADSSTPAAVRDAVLSRAAYDSLAVLVLEPAGALCRSEAENCLLESAGQAVSNRAGDVVFAGYWKRRQLYVVSGAPPALTSVGQLGAGPGEYQSLIQIGFARSGDILGLDMLQRRVLRYARDGRAISTSAIPIPPGFIDAAFVGGELRAVATELERRQNDSASVAVFSVDSGMSAPRKLFSLPVRQRAFGIMDLRPPGPMFGAQHQWVLRQDGGVYFSAAESFTIDAFDSSGRHEFRFGFDVVPRAVTGAEVERGRVTSLRGVTDPRMRGAIRGNSALPAARHPAVTRMKELENGQLWVREAEREAGDSVRWVVFGSDGTPVGAVTMGAEARVLTAHDGLVLISNPAETKVMDALRWYRVSRIAGRR